MDRTAYLDASALVKLIRTETETSSLRTMLRHWPHRTSSRLVRVEVLRAVRPSGASAVHAAYRVLEGVNLLPMTDAVLDEAVDAGPTMVRSLDAIHLASALSLGDDLGVLLTYDQRMLEAAAEAGIATAAPA